MNVIIGVDPHKASHHAVAVDDNEQELARFVHLIRPSSSSCRDEEGCSRCG